MRISDWSSDVCSSDLGNRALEEKAVGELARAAGKHPFDYFIDLALEEDLKTLFATEFSNYDVPAVTRILQDPDNQISLGDAGAHLSFLCEAGFGLHLLGRWVRDLRSEEHTSELQSLMRHSYDVLCLQKKNKYN